jgi:hypothetical protein
MVAFYNVFSSIATAKINHKIQQAVGIQPGAIAL